MTNTGRDLLIVAAAVTSLVSGIEAAAGQTRSPPPDAPSSDIQSRPDPRQDPRTTGSVRQSNQSLSEKLDSTGGVIRPPTDIAPDMAVRPPDPNPGTTRVIPPPGSPGGDPTIEPK